MAENDGAEERAPRYLIPQVRILSVEHPCIVKNVDRGIEMLGGGEPISATLDHASQKTLSLRFTPNGQSIMSMNNKTSNVLLKVTVPRRAAKRKRGTDDPYVPTTSPEAELDAKTILRTIKDNPQHTTIEALGEIENNHIFRTLPDFTYSTSHSNFKSEIDSKLLNQDLATIKQFTLPPTYGLQDTELFPPPVLSTFSLPQTYSYLDKATTKTTTSSAQSSTEDMIEVHDLQPNWPTSPSPTLPPISTLLPAAQTLLTSLRPLFATRPLWTRRALINNIAASLPVIHLRTILPYMAYHISSGPFRNLICAFSIDPRTHPQYSIYQTLQPRIDNRTARPPGWARSHHPLSHTYTGTEPATHFDGRYFQLIDITDPLLQSLIHSPTSLSPPENFDPINSGHYPSGLLAKVALIMRAKISAATTSTSNSTSSSSNNTNTNTNTNNPLPDSAFTHFLKLPDTWEFEPNDTHPDTNPETNPVFLPPDKASPLEMDMAEEWRRLVRQGQNKRSVVDGSLPASHMKKKRGGQGFGSQSGSVSHTPVRTSGGQSVSQTPVA